MKKRLVFAIVAGMLLISSAEVSAVDYYVATNGNNGNPGTFAKPWETLQYAESELSDGDVVYVRGGTYYEYFRIDVPNVTFQNYPGETPIIDGEYLLPPGDPDEWGSLVQIKSDNVTFDGFVVKRALGNGIQVYLGDNATIKNCEIYECQRMCLLLYQNANNALVEDCDIHHGAHRYITHPWEGVNPATVSVRYSEGATFRRCKIRDSYYEGFNLDNESSDILVEYCEIYGNLSHQLYMVCSKNNVIRYNLIYGTDNGTGPGIWMCVEPTLCTASYNGYHKIYGNLVANTNVNLWIAGDVNRKVYNCEIYNNTFVEKTSIASQGAIHINASSGGGHIFKNNIIWQTSSNIAYIPNGLADFDYNLWSRTPDTDAQGPNDPAYAIPQLAKTTGWDNLTGGELDGSEFVLQRGSPAINTGANLDSPYNQGLNPASTWPNNVSTLDQDDYGTGWEIGAYVFTGADINSDGKVNLEDFAVLATWWDDEDVCSSLGWCGGADFNMSRTVNMFDLAYFAENWLR